MKKTTREDRKPTDSTMARNHRVKAMKILLTD